MELQLKNIGMIKEANVKIDGLTVIAGENDTGKSTVGKALYVVLKAIYDVTSLINFDANFQNLTFKMLKHNFVSYYSLIFKEDLAEKSFLEISDSLILIQISREKDESNNDILSVVAPEVIETKNIKDVIFIESPLVWNFTDFFRDVAQVESQMNIKLEYPYLMKDLNFKLHIKSSSSGLDIKEKVTSLMGGEFKKDDSDHYYFYKGDKKIDLINTATGIKTFGIFQVLSQNNWLNKDTVLIIDEPEVHLHPKWQLEMAKIITELVKSGVKIVVNSHSPYMIEALKRYTEMEDVYSDTNFYLAEDGYIKQLEDSNAATLSKIFEKLSEPFDVFEEMESDSLEKLING